METERRDKELSAPVSLFPSGARESALNVQSVRCVEVFFFFFFSDSFLPKAASWNYWALVVCCQVSLWLSLSLTLGRMRALTTGCLSPIPPSTKKSAWTPSQSYRHHLPQWLCQPAPCLRPFQLILPLQPVGSLYKLESDHVPPGVCPGSPVVKTPCFPLREHGLNPWSRT